MNAPVNHTALATVSEHSGAVTIGFGTAGSFDLMQRAARLLANSTLVPAAYRMHVERKTSEGSQMEENPNAISNCVVALNMSQRMGADPLMVMQNLYIVEGRPSWSSQWIIAAINGCGRFSPLRFDFEDLGEKEVEYSTFVWENGANGKRQKNERRHNVKVRNLQCICWATEKATGQRIDSPRVTMDMAVQEGWYGKNGSKWQTMPEIMLRYRTASFFGKLYAPELLMGIMPEEETRDVFSLAPDGTVDIPGKPVVAMPVARAEPAQSASPVNGIVDQSTGEINPVVQTGGEMPAATEPGQAINPADSPYAGAEPVATPAKKAATHEPGAAATEGERKFILNRAKSAGVDVAALCEKAGIAGLPADLSGLTKDGFIALKDELPRSV